MAITKQITTILKITMKLVVFLLSLIPMYASIVINTTITNAGRLMNTCLPKNTGA